MTEEEEAEVAEFEQKLSTNKDHFLYMLTVMEPGPERARMGITWILACAARKSRGGQDTDVEEVLWHELRAAGFQSKKAHELIDEVEQETRRMLKMYDEYRKGAAE